MTKLRGLACVIAMECLIWATPARPDVVTDWNRIATETVASARPIPTSFLDLAMVHAAMHDAIQAYDGRFEPYAVAIPNARGSPVAAAATAAHDVLVARFPARAGALTQTLNDYLAFLGLQGDAGIGVGHVAALAIINRRAGDGSYPANPEVFNGGMRPGEWRPTLPFFAPMLVPWLGDVVPFTLKDPEQLGASPPPPHLGSGKYAHDYDEVKALGGQVSARTWEQTQLADFYNESIFVLWQRTLRDLAAVRIVNNIGDSARLFALANMAAADAVITAWADKTAWNFWRPITAIHEGDNDGNPKTAGDPTWLPLLATPPYPDYTSGFNAVTGAMTRTLERIFGNKTTFTVSSPRLDRTMTYHRFSDMADDIEDVRVYHGAHFRFADEAGRKQGKRAADWAVSHFLRPVR